MKSLRFFLIGITSLILAGCSTGSSSSDSDVVNTPTATTEDSSKLKAYYVDEPVANISYICGKYSDKTDKEGAFFFEKGKDCSFYISSLSLNSIKTDNLNDGDYVLESDSNVAALLLSLDKNRMYSDTIEVDPRAIEALAQLGVDELPKDDNERANLIKKINALLGDENLQAVTKKEAEAHLKQTIYNYDKDRVKLTEPKASWLDAEMISLYYPNSNGLDSDSQSATNSGTSNYNLANINWYSTTKIYTSELERAKEFEKRDYTLLAWSELGMHCMDGEYNVFALLPPYNTLKAQLIINGTSPRIASSDVTITYEAATKENGNINTTSQNKTDFWLYADKLFPTVGSLAVDQGLKGKPTQSQTPVAMDFNISQNLFVAEGIPATPKSDSGTRDEYPIVRVVAKDKNGEVLATTTTTLPVSDEMDCMRCHDSRVDILEKHDRNFPDAVKNLASELKDRGFDYDDDGLVATYKNKSPILCASCHKSNALVGSGIDGVKPLTEAIHSAHATRSDTNGELLGDGEDRNSCYACHPGEGTKCLRGAMGSAGVECQSCHGTMEAVGKTGRDGWKEEPNCQACHQDGKRYEDAVTNKSLGTLREALDSRFATEQANIDTHPRLYKHSTGHGGIACAGCHGAQHAIYPSSVDAENRQNIEHQGYKGTLRECGVCHKNEPAITAHNGPHGLHTIGQRWVDMHGTVVLREGLDNCKSCHGTDLEGSFLSKVGTDREFKLGVMNKKVSFEAGEKVSCKKCHNSNLMEVSK
jgi:hypothetical protein